MGFRFCSRGGPPSDPTPRGRSRDMLAYATKSMCSGDNVVFSTISVVLCKAEGAEAMPMWLHEKP